LRQRQLAPQNEEGNEFYHHCTFPLTVIDVRRLAQGEHSHATRDPRRVREYFLGTLPQTSFRAPAALVVIRNAELRSPCASLPA